MSSATAARKEPPRHLREWLERHRRECLETTETWMVRSLPIATRVIAAVWQDPAWREALRNAVVWPVHEDASADADHVAFLAAASDERGLGLISVDGETHWLRAEAVGIPHPAIMAELEELREFATELDLEQQLHQLHREIWSKPADANARIVSAFAGGRFQQLMQATNRARSLGYSIRGGNAVCRIWDAGQFVEARYWIGSDEPTNTSVTGNLEWVGRDGQSLPLGQLGTIAYSEGMRMAARIYAARTPQEQAA